MEIQDGVYSGHQIWPKRAYYIVVTASDNIEKAPMLKKNTKSPQQHHRNALIADALYQQLDLGSFAFGNTAEIKRKTDFNPLDIQLRAKNALKFAMQPGQKQHLYVYAQSQSERQDWIREYLLHHTAEVQSSDWVYLPNYIDNPYPLLVRLSPGEGKVLQQKIRDFVRQLYLMLPASLAATGYTARFETLETQLQSRLKTKERCENNWHEAFAALNHETSQVVLTPLLQPLKKYYANNEPVVEFLNQLAVDFEQQLPVLLQKEDFDDLSAHLKRYQVNLFISNKKGNVPLVYEDNITLHQLFGQILDGDDATEVMRIRPGAIQRANGGFLFLDAEKLLQHAEIWDKLKDSLLNHSATLPVSEEHSEAAEGKIIPAAMPLDVQVILFGRQSVHNLMCSKDVVFDQLFRIALDFDYEVKTSEAALEHLLQYIAYKLDEQVLRPFSKPAVARIIEAGQRYIEDREMIGLYEATFNPLLLEANYIAQQQLSSHVELEHVTAAIAQQDFRQNRLAMEQQQEILRDTLLIDTQGNVIAQVNGLFIIELGDYNYGLPARITATAGVGEGEVIDIEREVELGGNLHSKGVMILSAYLVSVFGHDKPMSLMASLVLEQSYSQVDGDSASAGELCALISALANVGIKQSIGITGSVNQRGELQAIGGVNEKIEGFYSLCAERGDLDGSHGVIIPQANVSSLMLNEKVIQAVNDSKFFVYAVSDITQAMEILTGMDYSEIYQQADEQLKTFATIRQQYSK